jgi:hypothetical protein
MDMQHTGLIEAAAQMVAAPAAVATGIAPGAMVLTATGERAVQDLVPGDRIITRDGIRRLRAVTRHQIGAAAVIVSSQALGHDRPSADVVLGADQPILLRDWRAEALYGSPTAVVALARLVDGEYIRRAGSDPVEVLNLQFDTPCVIYVSGLELACPGALTAI